MGAARRRGTREERIAQAVAQGRVKRGPIVADVPLRYFDPLPIGDAAALAALVAASIGRRRLR